MSLRITPKRATETQLDSPIKRQSSIQEIAYSQLPLETLMRQAHLRERFIMRFNQLDALRFFPNPSDLREDYSTTLSSWKTLYKLIIQSDPALHRNIFQRRVQQEYQIFILTKLSQDTLFAQQALHKGIIKGQVEERDIDEIAERSMIGVAAQALDFLFQKTSDPNYHRNACIIAAVDTGNVQFIKAIAATGPTHPSARLEALFKAIDLGLITIATYFFDTEAAISDNVLSQIILRAARSGNSEMLKALISQSNISNAIIEYAIKTLSFHPIQLYLNTLDLAAFFDKPGWFHFLIINIGKEMGYNTDPLGMCLGIVATAHQAILLSEIDSFNLRLEKIALTYDSCKARSSEESQAIRLTAAAFKKDIDVRAFFDTIHFLQSTLNGDPCITIDFSSSPKNKEEDCYSVICSPKIAAQGGIDTILTTTGIYNFSELQKHLHQLKAFLDKHKTDYTTPITPWVAINLYVPLHTIGFGYNLHSQELVINDSNTLPIKPVKTIEDLAQLIYRSLTQQMSKTQFDSSQLIMIATQVLCLKTPNAQRHSHPFSFSIVDPCHFLKTRFIDTSSKFSLLTLACRHENLQTLEALIHSGADLNYSANGETPLILACYFSYISIVKRLIEAGVDVNWANEKGVTALLHACIAGNMDIVLLMLQAKANPNVFDNQNNTPLRYAIKHSNINLITNLISSGANPNLIDPEGSTPLHYAASQKDPAVALKLLEASALVDVKDSQGWTPLMLAAYYNHDAVAQLLLRRGSDPSAVNHKNESPLHFAVFQKNISLVSLLLESGADVHRVTQEGLTPLHFAAETGSGAITQLLLDASALVDAKDNEEQTPLMSAVKNNHTETAQLLLKAGANANLFNQNWDSPLCLAIKEKNMNLLTLLIEAGASLNLPNPKGCSSMHFAAHTGDLAIIQLLLDAKAMLDLQDNEGWTPLMFACQTQHHKVANLLLKVQANPNTFNRKGDNSLSLAIKQNDLSLVSLLIDAGANVNLRHSNRWTALHYAAFQGDVAITQRLLEAQAEIDPREKEDWTPLMYAAQENHPEVIQLLLKAGANPNLTDSVDGWSPLMLAAQYGHTKVIEILIQYGANPSLRNSNGFDACSIAIDNNHTDAVSLLKIGSP